MKRNILPVFFIFLSLYSCNGDEEIPNSGEVSINNKLEWSADLQTWVIEGFIFSEGILATDPGTPKPDITIDNDGTLANLILQTNNYKNSFYKAGEYADAAAAEEAFNALVSFTFPSWESWAFSIKPNQIWIFRTSAEKYAKFRIISTVSEVREEKEYAECTFEWVYQPDGSLTFPAK